MKVTKASFLSVKREVRITIFLDVFLEEKTTEYLFEAVEAVVVEVQKRNKLDALPNSGTRSSFLLMLY